MALILTVSVYSTGVVTITSADNEAPTLTIIKPDGIDDEIAEGASFTVQYDLYDPDDIVTADFYYDTNNSGLDGVAILGCQDQPEGTGETCIWDTTGVTPGTYYVYGITNDGTNPQISVYSTGFVTINDSPILNIDQPDGIDDKLPREQITLFNMI
jgi:hypothetical protein